MAKISTLTLVAALSLLGASAANAQGSAAGAWTVAYGNSASCPITLSADTDGAAGTATAGANCNGATQKIGRWKQTPRGVNLESPNGELLAVLTSTGGNYTGKSVENDRKIVLSHEAVAQNH